jgi:uncharacterized protein (DUF736 family)
MREYAVGAGVNASHRVIIREARQNNVDGGRKLSHALRNGRAASGQRRHFGTISVVDTHLVAGLEQTPRDRPSHRADANKSELGVNWSDSSHFKFLVMSLDATLFAPVILSVSKGAEIMPTRRRDFRCI